MTAAERREQLIGVALGLFAERGFDGSAIEEVANRAAVSKPIVTSVPAISLSIVPGKPTQGMSNSLLNFWAPLKLPSPPIMTRPSIPLLLRFE